MFPKDHTPIRNIRIDAGDGVSEYKPSHGSYPTYRGKETVAGALVDICKPDAEATEFTDVKDKACTEAPFSYSVLYDCPGPDLYSTTEQCADQATPNATGSYPTWNTAWNTHGCWDPNYPRTDGSGLSGACIFRPRIQVQDNWGYCTGRCGNAGSPGGTKCYEGSGSTS